MLSMLGVTDDHKDLNKEIIDLDATSDEELLEIRINELPLKIEGTWLSECIAQLYRELQEKGISLNPQCYLADEWLTPKDQTCIGILFFFWCIPHLLGSKKNICWMLKEIQRQCAGSCSVMRQAMYCFMLIN